MDNRSRIWSKNSLLFAILAAGVIVAFAGSLFAGSVAIGPAETLRALFGHDVGNTASTIVMKFRLPRSVTALLAGIALAVSGLQMQTIFRNPMAGPYVLGISSGASLGVAVVILGFASFLPLTAVGLMGSWLIAIAAWAGAGAVMVVMLFMAARLKNILTVLVLGIMVAGGISSLVTIMQYFSGETVLRSYVVWTMGSLGNLSATQIQIMGSAITVGLLIGLVATKSLNAMILGDSYASTIGVNIRRARLMIFLSTTVLAGSVTAFCGPIGFIGIAVPHIARMLFRSADHRVLLPATMLAGALLMLISDIISQLPGSDSVLPINAVTSLLGIPVVIWVLLKGDALRSHF